MNVAVSLKPVCPFFLGEVKELMPTTAPHSRALPSIYTAGGAVLAMLQKDGFDAEKLETLIFNGELKIFGTYMCVEGRYYVPAPLTLVSGESRKTKEVAVVSVIEEPWAYGLFKRCGVKVPFDPSVEVKHADVLIPVDKLPDVDVKDVCIFNVESREKLGIALDRFKRATLAPYLYTRVDVEGIETESGQLAFCVDVEAPEDVVNVLRQKRELIKFGGEGSVALACPEPDALLAKKATRKPEHGKVYLAVSHIRVELVDKELAVRLGDEVFLIEWCVGRVEPLSGWLLRGGRPKKTVATLTPGTVFKLGPVRRHVQQDEWYFKLLNTIAEIKVS